MEKLLPVIIIALCAVIILLLIVIIARKPQSSSSIDTAVFKEQLRQNARQTDEKIDRLSSGMSRLTNTNYEQQINLMNTLNANTEKQTKALTEAIAVLQKGNEEKLEQMRKTVDEKLTETLNQRLNTSFRAVSDQLSNVYKSLGEMKELSAGVTATVSGLNRTLTNVKTRGTWAEVQLGNLLEQIIPNMFECNVQTNPAYNGRVEFAVRIPNQENGSCIYLPIDSKFPLEDYARLTAAADNADTPAMEAARKALEARVREFGRDIKKYISLPHTTPFAVMYLATEGLYAEIISSKSGVAEKLQADGILLAGPSTIVALLNSLALGFRTIAINEKANEVWKILGTAKAQYDKFGDLLKKAKDKIEAAGKALDEADHRNNIIQKQLKGVETIEE